MGEIKMNRYFLILILVPFLLGSRTGKSRPRLETVEDLPRYLEQIVFTEGQSYIRSSWLPPEFELAAIQYLLEKSKDKEPRVQMHAKAALVGLLHKETMDSVIADYKREDETASQILKEAAGSSDLLQSLIPIFYSSSLAPRRNHWNQDIPESKTHVSDLIFNCIVNEERFPKETKDWATTLGGQASNSNEGLHFHPIWLLQQFLENNKEALAAKDYTKATWLPTFEGQTDRFLYEWRSLPNYIAHMKATQELVKHQAPVDVHPRQFTERPSRRPPAIANPQVSRNATHSKSRDTKSQSPATSTLRNIGLTSCITVLLAAILWRWNAKRKAA